MKTTNLIKFGLGLTLASGALTSFAATTADIAVTATVDQSCTITAQPLSFGKYDPISTTDKASSSQLTLTCVKNSKPTVTLSYGDNVGQGGTERRMTNGTEFLPYEVYKPLAADATTDLPNTQCSGPGADNVVWGGEVATGLHPVAAADATAKDYFLCGVIKAGHDVGAGNYADKLTATFSF